MFSLSFSSVLKMDIYLWHTFLQQISIPKNLIQAQVSSLLWYHLMDFNLAEVVLPLTELLAILHLHGAVSSLTRGCFRLPEEQGVPILKLKHLWKTLVLMLLTNWAASLCVWPGCLPEVESIPDVQGLVILTCCCSKGIYTTTFCNYYSSGLSLL